MAMDRSSSILYPEDSLPVGKSAIAGFQHVIAMFGGTILCPLLMGFAPNIAILCFGLSPKFGALIQTIPQPIMGGLSMVVFGLITTAAGRICGESRVDFTDPRNLIMVGVAMMIAAGDLSLKIGDFVLSGIGLATLASLVLHHGLGLRFRPKMVTVRPPATD